MKPGWFRLGVALAAALPCMTSAFEWSGRLGMLYSRDEQWTPTSGGRTVPRLDLDLSLDGNGYVYTPETLVLGGGFGYRRFTMNPSNGPSSSLDQVAYRLRASAFNRADSPFSVSGFASRADGDGGGSSGGFRTFEQTYGANMAFRLLNRPTLELGYAHSDGRYSSPGRPASESARESFSAATAYATSSHGYDVAYRANLASGTFAADNFDDHRVDVNARVNLSRDVRLQLGDGYYHRQPTLQGDFNPKQELNVFSSLVRHEPTDGSFDQVRYVHVSAVTDSQRQTFTRNADTLDLSLRRPVTGTPWSFQGTLAANYSETMVTSTTAGIAGQEQRTAGQTLSATVHWRRAIDDVQLDAFAGPTLGLVEPFDGTTKFGYGASAGGAAQRQFQRLVAGVRYGVAYASAAGSLTTSLSQSVSADAEGPLGAGRLHGTVTATGERSHDPLTGDSASRSLRARLDYGQRHYGAFTEAQLRDGVAFPLRDPFRGDGLFLSPGYDAKSRSVTAGLRGRVLGLETTAALRLSTQEMPDRPATDELEARGEITYRIGAFGMGFEDRYVVGLRDRSRFNIVVFRVYRLLGSRY